MGARVMHSCCQSTWRGLWGFLESSGFRELSQHGSGQGWMAIKRKVLSQTEDQQPPRNSGTSWWVEKCLWSGGRRGFTEAAASGEHVCSAGGGV